MARTALEINAELAVINGALQSLYTGTRVSELRVDTHILRRYYKYSEITVENLQAQKYLLEQELLSLTTTLPTFRQFASMPIVVSKQGIY
jgi:hypothetical protein